jgi:hypothetical protein
MMDTTGDIPSVYFAIATLFASITACVNFQPVEVGSGNRLRRDCQSTNRI